jgi:hypothetical protein
MTYRKIGDLLHFTLKITITAVGTATAGVRISLPFNPVGDWVFSGRENAINGKQLQGICNSGNNTISIYNYDNTSAAASGAQLHMSGVVRV